MGVSEEGGHTHLKGFIRRDLQFTVDILNGFNNEGGTWDDQERKITSWM